MDTRVYRTHYRIFQPRPKKKKNNSRGFFFYDFASNIEWNDSSKCRLLYRVHDTFTDAWGKHRIYSRFVTFERLARQRGNVMVRAFRRNFAGILKSGQMSTAGQYSNKRFVYLIWFHVNHPTYYKFESEERIEFYPFFVYTIQFRIF